MDATAVKNGVLAVLAAVGAWIANKCGGWDAAMQVLVGFMAIDYITGILVALIFHLSPKTAGGGLSSGECFKGLVRKCMILVFVWVGSGLDTIVGGTYVRAAIIIFFIGNEGLSILENGGLMGVPYPRFLKNALEAIKDKGDSGENGTDVSSADSNKYDTL